MSQEYRHRGCSEVLQADYRRNRLCTGAALWFHGGGIGLHHQLRHQVSHGPRLRGWRRRLKRSDDTELRYIAPTANAPRMPKGWHRRLACDSLFIHRRDAYAILFIHRRDAFATFFIHRRDAFATFFIHRRDACATLGGHSLRATLWRGSKWGVCSLPPAGRGG